MNQQNPYQSRKKYLTGHVLAFIEKFLKIKAYEYIPYEYYPDYVNHSNFIERLKTVKHLFLQL